MKLVDLDHHYYEPDDAYTRHLPADYGGPRLHIDRTSGAGRPMFGGEPLYFLHTTPLDRVGRPGIFAKGSAARFSKEGTAAGSGRRVEGDTEVADKSRELLVSPKEIPSLVDRDARLQWLDDEGVDACVMYPSLGLCTEYQMRSDAAAYVANMRAFNRWLLEDWGFGADRRIYGVPHLTLIDIDDAVRELEWCLSQGARVVHLLFSPLNGRSLAHPDHDRFWVVMNEAQAVISFHGADGGYGEMVSANFGEKARPGAHERSAFQRAMCMLERPIMDTLASLVLHNLFGRFPNVRAASIENGSNWVPYLLRVMDIGAQQGEAGIWLGGKIADKPSDIFSKHCYVAPNAEDDVRGLIDLIGISQVLLGSDYPHPEGAVVPAQFFDSAALTDAEARAVYRDNGARLLWG